jgi:hypothetical protein
MARHLPYLVELRAGLTEDLRYRAKSAEISLESGKLSIIGIGRERNGRLDLGKGDRYLILQRDATPVERGRGFDGTNVDLDPMVCGQLVQDHIGASVQGCDHGLKWRGRRIGPAAVFRLVDEDVMAPRAHFGARVSRAGAVEHHLRVCFLANCRHAAASCFVVLHHRAVSSIPSSPKPRATKE